MALIDGINIRVNLSHVSLKQMTFRRECLFWGTIGVADSNLHRLIVVKRFREIARSTIGDMDFAGSAHVITI